MKPTLEVGNTYPYRDGVGEPVKIIGMTGSQTFPFRGDNNENYTRDGCIFTHKSSVYDINPEAPLAYDDAHAEPTPKATHVHEPNAVVVKSDATRFSGDPNFARLRNTLLRAYLQVAEGKGAERHGNGKPWPEQPMFKIAEMVGTGFHLGQAIKKIDESTRLPGEAAVKELLGAITYLAAAIEAIEEGKR